MIEEAEITCPHCWETISLMLDLSAGHQDYIEDCAVCCHPMRVMISANDGQLLDVQVEQTGG